jgi:hypothetical protein
MKVIVYVYEPDGAMWSIIGVEGSIYSLGRNDTWVQLNLSDKKKRIIPLSSIFRIDIVKRNTELIEK